MMGVAERWVILPRKLIPVSKCDYHIVSIPCLMSQTARWLTFHLRQPATGDSTLNSQVPTSRRPFIPDNCWDGVGILLRVARRRLRMTGL